MKDKVKVSENKGIKERLLSILSGEYRGLFIWTAVVIVLFCLFLLIIPGNNVFTWIRASRETSKMESSLEECRQRTDSIEQRIRDLKSNPDSLEKFAREEFQFAAGDEDVYVITE